MNIQISKAASQGLNPRLGWTWGSPSDTRDCFQPSFRSSRASVWACDWEGASPRLPLIPSCPLPEHPRPPEGRRLSCGSSRTPTGQLLLLPSQRLQCFSLYRQLFYGQFVGRVTPSQPSRIGCAESGWSVPILPPCMGSLVALAFCHWSGGGGNTLIYWCKIRKTWSKQSNERAHRIKDSSPQKLGLKDQLHFLPHNLWTSNTY